MIVRACGVIVANVVRHSEERCRGEAAIERTDGKRPHFSVSGRRPFGEWAQFPVQLVTSLRFGCSLTRACPRVPRYPARVGFAHNQILSLPRGSRRWIDLSITQCSLSLYKYRPVVVCGKSLRKDPAKVRSLLFDGGGIPPTDAREKRRYESSRSEGDILTNGATNRRGVRGIF